MKILTVTMLCAALCAGHDDPPVKPELRMKPAVTLRGMHVTIGDLCEIKPLDESTLALAQLRFGPAPSQGFARTVSRADLVQALAGAGVQLTTVELTGSSEVVVQTLLVDVSQQDLLEAANAALQAHLDVEGGDVEFDAPTQVRFVQAPPGRMSLDLRARVRDARTGAATAVVDVDVLVDDEAYRKVSLNYRLRRYHRVLKTVGTIAKDAPLGPDNVVLVREQLTQHTGLYLDRGDQIEGMVAARDLQPNRLLTLGDIAAPALIRRGDVVTVVLTKGRVRVTAKAIANEDAPLAGRIQMTNMNSRSLLTGIVRGPGLVVVNQ